jgi:hypothetical protein
LTGFRGYVPQPCPEASIAWIEMERARLAFILATAGEILEGVGLVELRRIASTGEPLLEAVNSAVGKLRDARAVLDEAETWEEPGDDELEEASAGEDAGSDPPCA